MPLPLAIEQFINDLRADRDFDPEVADKLAELFGETDIEADYNNHAGAFLMAVEWIVGHRDRSVRERLEMVHRLVKLKGYSEINLREFTGWD
jgi:hypothetical protein